MQLCISSKLIWEKDITEFINSMEELETLTGEDIYRVCNKYLNKPTIHILKPME